MPEATLCLIAETCVTLCPSPKPDQPLSGFLNIPHLVAQSFFWLPTARTVGWLITRVRPTIAKCGAVL